MKNGNHFVLASVCLLKYAEWRIYVSKLNITGADNGLSPGRRQVITWTNAGML